MLDREVDNLASSLSDDHNMTRLRTARAPHACDWLFALLIAVCGLRIDDKVVIVAVAHWSKTWPFLTCHRCSSIGAGAAELAADRKLVKYKVLAQSYPFYIRSCGF